MSKQILVVYVTTYLIRLFLSDTLNLLYGIRAK